MRTHRYSHYLVLLCLLALLSSCGGCSTGQSSEKQPNGRDYKPRPEADVKASAKNTEEKKPKPVLNAPIPSPLPNPKIVIRKKTRELSLYSGKKLVRVYPIILGLNPIDDKARQGDNCTPEGSFYICTKNPRSKFHLSLGLSYPNIEDAERGLRNKLITRDQYDTIVQGISTGGIPPWNTPLGGEIFIHGEAETWDWTYGCVALANKHIEELYRVIKVGTAVEIRK